MWCDMLNERHQSFCKWNGFLLPKAIKWPITQYGFIEIEAVTALKKNCSAKACAYGEQTDKRFRKEFVFSTILDPTTGMPCSISKCRSIFATYTSIQFNENARLFESYTKHSFFLCFRTKKVKVEQSPPWLNITQYQMHLKKAGQYSRSCCAWYRICSIKNGYGCSSVIVSDCRRGRRTAHGCSVQTSSPHALQSTSAMTLILKWVCF